MRRAERMFTNWQMQACPHTADMRQGSMVLYSITLGELTSAALDNARNKLALCLVLADRITTS